MKDDKMRNEKLEIRNRLKIFLLQMLLNKK